MYEGCMQQVPETIPRDKCALPQEIFKGKKRIMDKDKVYRIDTEPDHLQHELSGGQQQRVAIAGALVNMPKILFADEPCANPDRKSSRQILELFKRLNEELEQTIVMVTHEDWHVEYTNRSIYLKDGLI